MLNLLTWNINDQVSYCVCVITGWIHDWLKLNIVKNKLLKLFLHWLLLRFHSILQHWPLGRVDKIHLWNWKLYLNREQLVSTCILNWPSSLVSFFTTLPPKVTLNICNTCVIQCAWHLFCKAQGLRCFLKSLNPYIINRTSLCFKLLKQLRHLYFFLNVFESQIKLLGYIQ